MKKNQDKETDKLKSLNIDYFKYRTKFTKKFAERTSYEAKDPQLVLAFIPGTIRKISAQEGEAVKEGDLLLILEAMKMKNRILSPVNGTVKKINVKPGDIVAKNSLLVELEEDEIPTEN